MGLDGTQFLELVTFIIDLKMACTLSESSAILRYVITRICKNN